MSILRYTGSDSVANLVEKTFQYAMQALQDTVCVLSPVALEKGARLS